MKWVSNSPSLSLLPYENHSYCDKNARDVSKSWKIGFESILTYIKQKYIYISQVVQILGKSDIFLWLRHRVYNNLITNLHIYTYVLHYECLCCLLLSVPPSSYNSPQVFIFYEGTKKSWWASHLFFPYSSTFLLLPPTPIKKIWIGWNCTPVIKVKKNLVLSAF